MPQAPFVVLGNSPSHPALQAPHAQPPPRHPGDQWPPSPPHCGPLEGPDRHLSLRVVSIFVIFAASTLATLLPILASRVRARRRSSTSADSNGNNGLLLDFFKHFGSGVIISTAFIHLLSPAFKAFNSPCVARHWRHYPWAEAVAMTAVFSLFFVEVSARRWSSSQSPTIGTRDAHSNGQPAVNLRRSMSPAAITIATDLHQPPNGHIVAGACVKTVVLCNDSTSLPDVPLQDATLRAQIIGVAILEFGVVFHSVIVGLALATDPKFVVLFVVLTCHQSFEGLGLGARLATLRLHPRHNWIRYAGATLFGLSTSAGIGLGLALRHIYSPHSSTALIFSGFCDAMSAGILLYTGLVELLAHEFLSNPHLDLVSNSRLMFMCASMMLGASLMALLGRWA